MIWLKFLFITSLFFNSLPVNLTARHTPKQASAYEIIDAVNVMRAQYGLAPYTIDQRLMGIAQAQSEYQASITTMTHKRPDGSDASIVSSENIAPGTAGASASSIVHRWTLDYPHTITLIGFRTGLVGAGAATGSDGLIYYTLDVTNTGKTLTGLTADSLPAATSVPGAPTNTPGPTAPIIQALLTATSQADGSVLHTVAYGQTLSGIAKAYNLEAKDLAAQNHIDLNSMIQVGQHLLIRPAFTPTPEVTPTITTDPPTASPTASPTGKPTLTPQPSPTRVPNFFILSTGKWSSAVWIGVILSLLCILGLLLAIFGRRFKHP